MLVVDVFGQMVELDVVETTPVVSVFMLTSVASSFEVATAALVSSSLLTSSIFIVTLEAVSVDSGEAVVVAEWMPESAEEIPDSVEDVEDGDDVEPDELVVLGADVVAADAISEELPLELEHDIELDLLLVLDSWAVELQLFDVVVAEE